jgi:hypothetical protein
VRWWRDEPVLSEKRDSNFRNALRWGGCLTDGCFGCLSWVLAAATTAAWVWRRHWS